MDKKMGLRAFFVMAGLTLVLGWATWDEHVRGTGHVYETFYNSMWFTLLWVLLATLACYYVMVTALYKRLSIFLLHVALLVILSGALVTRLTGRSGQVHLRENHTVSFFLDESVQRKVTFPFSLSLKSFEIENYPGTASPADYVTVVEVKDAATGEKFERTISMNNILRCKGFRFYQSDYDQDLRGSILSVSHDPWGIALTYIGYFLMFISMLFILFDKRERFRYLLKKLAQKPALLALFLLVPLSGKAAEPLLTSDSLTVSVQQAEKLGSLCVDYHGRICPVQTLTYDFTAKLTGKTRYKYASGEQVFFGWMLFPEKWKSAMMFEIKNDELKRIINSSGTACFDDFFEPNGQYKLQPYLHGSGRSKSFAKEVSKLNDKIQLLYGMIVNGYLLNFFPLPDAGGKVQWYTPNAPLPVGTVHSDSVFVRQFLVDYKKALLDNNADAAAQLIDRMSAFQHEKAGAVLPSDMHLKIEKAYNRLHIFSLLFKICLGIGSAALLFFIFGTIRSKAFPRAEKVFNGLLWLAFAVATVGLGMRAYIGGRLPLSNGYETMLLLAWLSLLTAVLSRRYSFLIVVFGFMLSGFTLLVAHIGSMDPQITPLMPVLQSPLLSIHVLTIMVAYGLCGFMALNSITALIVRLIGGNRQDRTDYVERMKETCELFMYPATFLMGAGIFIGAIWANVSWGRYWGWDPKEVWALITFMLMSFTFHGKTIKWFRNPVFYHIFVLVIFLAVLMTYFGVNYILGGRHSYAG